MRHALLHNPRGVAMRRALSRHRPPSPTKHGADEMKATDLILAVLGIALLGAMALMAGIALVGRTLSL